MFYLLIQTWIWMLLAAVLGLVIGWLIWGRGRNENCSDVRRALDECRKKCANLEKETTQAGNMAEMESSVVEESAVEDQVSRVTDDMKSVSE